MEHMDKIINNQIPETQKLLKFLKTLYLFATF